MDKQKFLQFIATMDKSIDYDRGAFFYGYQDYTGRRACSKGILEWLLELKEQGVVEYTTTGHWRIL